MPEEHPRSSHDSSHETADLIFDSFYAGAIGGSVVALFFLFIDVMNGQPLFTPSLMGSVLIGGAVAASVFEVHLDMVAYYTIVHFLIFGALGAFVSLAVRKVVEHAHHPGLVLLGLFGLFEVAFILFAAFVMPGVIERVGAVPVLLANLMAAGSMAGFLFVTHRPAAWQHLKHSLHLA